MGKVNNPVETDKLQSVCSSVISADKLMTPVSVFRASEKLIDFLNNRINGTICVLTLKTFTQLEENRQLDNGLKLKICWVKGKKRDLKYICSNIFCKKKNSHDN